MPAGVSETEPETGVARGAYPVGTREGERGLRRCVAGAPGGATVTGQLPINHLARPDATRAIVNAPSTVKQIAGPAATPA